MSNAELACDFEAIAKFVRTRRSVIVAVARLDCWLLGRHLMLNALAREKKVSTDSRAARYVSETEQQA